MKAITQAVFLDTATLGEGVDLTPLRATVKNLRCYHETAPHQLKSRVRDAQVIISNKVTLDAQTITDCDQLQLICVAATGANNIDLDAAKACNIKVRNARNYSTAAVAQHTIAMLLGLATNWHRYTHAVHAGRWQSSRQFCFFDYPIIEVAGLTLGIIGYGNLGRAVAERATALGMQILIAQRPGTPNAPMAERTPLPELLAQSDFVSLHCPLTTATQNLLGADELAQMKSTAFLINTARGGIVDEVALTQSLQRGDIAGAACDVLSVEPPREGNPLLAPDIPNLLLTPHVAWGTLASRQRCVQDVADNIIAFTQGQARNDLLD